MGNYTYINKLQQVSVTTEIYKEKVTKILLSFFSLLYQEVVNMRIKKAHWTLDSMTWPLVHIIHLSILSLYKLLFHTNPIPSSVKFRGSFSSCVLIVKCDD